ncbi:MAG: aspartate/glutamate racemase family protein [Emergencia sp.]|nr:aspartate/glutamate racemase family protein [Emergencia sp.]
MKILFVNPNSSALITNILRKEAEKYAGENLIIDVTACADVPTAIETRYDELLAGSQVVKLLQDMQGEYDGAVIGCFADPGLSAARDLLGIPVVGLYESSSFFAKFHGGGYSIIASGDYRDISAWHGSIRAIGDSQNVTSIRCLNSTVEDAAGESDEKICKLIERCKVEDGAEAIILGCAAFAGRGAKLSAMMDIPVIDGIEESIRIIEMLCKYRRKEESCGKGNTMD